MSYLSTPAPIPAACEKVISLIADYLDGELDLDLQVRFERHLSQCPECLAYVNTYRQTIRLIHSLYNDTASDVQTYVFPDNPRSNP